MVSLLTRTFLFEWYKVRICYSVLCWVGHVYVSGLWLGTNLKDKHREKYVLKKDWSTHLEFDNYFALNSRRKWERPIVEGSYTISNYGSRSSTSFSLSCVGNL